MKKLVVLLAALALMATTACVYKPSVQQGNVLDQKDVNQIRPGMTKEQVRFVLGNPVLNTNLEGDTWYYLYYLYPSRGDDVQKRLVLRFQQNVLVSTEGTVKPELATE